MQGSSHKRRPRYHRDREEDPDQEHSFSTSQQHLGFLLQPALGTKVIANARRISKHHARGLDVSSKAHAKGLMGNTPFLTLTLLKLEELSTEFCARVANPSHGNVCKACTALDSSVATAATSSPTASPKRNRGVVTPSSPTRSPLLHWISSTSAAEPLHKSGASYSAAALEGEWEEFQRPFLLFAAAEEMYAGMRHITAIMKEDKSESSQLGNLYRFVESEFLQIQRKLCLPLLLKPAPNDHQGAALSTSKHSIAAASLSDTLMELSRMCRCREHMVDFQLTLFASTIPMYDKAEHVVRREISAFDGRSSSSSSAFAPVQENLAQELKSWQQLLVAAHSLERCLFLESIVSLRKLQKALSFSSKPQTRLFGWFDATLQHFQSLLPVYFDRVHAFAQPLYNFETEPVAQITGQDWNALIVSFLRRQEQLGGPHTTVTLVLDAVATNNLNVERGFFSPPSPRLRNNGKGSEGQFDTRALWPAVYLRSTVLLNLSRSGDRQSNRSLSSLTRRVRTSATLGGSSLSSASQQSTEEPQSSVLHYGPDTGMPATTWPHSDWLSLTSILAKVEAAPGETGSGETDDSVTAHLSIRMAHEPVAVSFREGNRCASPPEPSSPVPTHKFLGLFGRGRSIVKKEGQENERASGFHVVSISKFLTLAVMLKPDDEVELGNFLRKRARIPDDEVRQFLNEMADALTVSRQFSLERVEKDGKKDPKEEDYNQSFLGGDEGIGIGEMQLLLKQIKKKFGLRPPSPYQEKQVGRRVRSVGTRQRNSGHNRTESDGSEFEPSFSQSAASFFLGSKLVGVFEH